MSGFEQLSLSVAGLLRRIEMLELAVNRLNQRGASDGQDEARTKQAMALAEKMGLPGSVFWADGKPVDRRRLALALEAKGWTSPQVGRMLGVSERTVHRYFQHKAAG